MTMMSRRDPIGRGTLLTASAALLGACGPQQPPAALPWGNTGSEVTLVSPGNVIPIALDTSFGPAYGCWYLTNGAEGKQPAEPEMVQAMDLLRKAPRLPENERVKAAQEIWRRAIDAQWSIGLVGQGGAVMGIRVVKNPSATCPSDSERSVIPASRVLPIRRCSTSKTDHIKNRPPEHSLEAGPCHPHA